MFEQADFQVEFEAATFGPNDIQQTFFQNAIYSQIIMYISVHHVETSVRDTSPSRLQSKSTLQGTWVCVACCESPLPGHKPQTAAVC